MIGLLWFKLTLVGLIFGFVAAWRFNKNLIGPDESVTWNGITLPAIVWTAVPLIILWGIPLVYWFLFSW